MTNYILWQSVQADHRKEMGKIFKALRRCLRKKVRPQLSHTVIQDCEVPQGKLKWSWVKGKHELDSFMRFKKKDQEINKTQRSRGDEAVTWNTGKLEFPSQTSGPIVRKEEKTPTCGAVWNHLCQILRMWGWLGFVYTPQPHGNVLIVLIVL